SPHRLSGDRRRGAGGDGLQARRRSSPANHRAEGPQLLSLGLFPRARPRAVRNRHRSARLRHRRTARFAWGSAQTAAVPGRPPRGDRSRAAEARLAHETNLAISDAPRRPMMAPELAYIHRFEPGADPSLPPVLLLHGTGGDETDLLPLGREIAPGAALLSPRGNVLEGDRPRFFRRFREGLFDEDDVRRRAGELADFVAAARRAYGLAAPLALGYSNRATIADA